MKGPKYTLNGISLCDYCPNCDGEGNLKFVDADGREEPLPSTCDYCEGKGHVLTEPGAQILALIHDFFGKE